MGYRAQGHRGDGEGYATGVGGGRAGHLLGGGRERVPALQCVLVHQESYVIEAMLFHPICDLCGLPGVEKVTIDQCQYPAPHEKPTALLSNCASLRALGGSLSR
eukprot:4544578-Pyramimonas_sp.AAC.1